MRLLARRSRNYLCMISSLRSLRRLIFADGVNIGGSRRVYVTRTQVNVDSVVILLLNLENETTTSNIDFLVGDAQIVRKVHQLVDPSAEDIHIDSKVPVKRSTSNHA